jgi:hypothetical protein
VRKAHDIAVGLQAVAVGAEDLADLGQAPAQRAARVVGHVPEQLAQPLAALRAADAGEIHQQRARLLRRRQPDGLIVTGDDQVAEDADFQLSRQWNAFSIQARPILTGNARGQNFNIGGKSSTLSAATSYGRYHAAFHVRRASLAAFSGWSAGATKEK